MSRHRIVRTMDYKDEYDSYDDVYGHSVDDDNCISPTDAQQWIFDRAKGQQSISAFMANNRNIKEEDEADEDDDNDDTKKRRDSENYQMPVLDDIEQAKLLSCIDEIRSVVGDAISERQIVETAMIYDYNVTKTLDSILNTNPTPPTASAVAGGSSVPPMRDINTTAKSLKNVTIGNEKDLKSNLDIKVDTKVNKLNELLKNNLKVSSTNDNSISSNNLNKSNFILPKLNSENTSTHLSTQLNQFLSKLNKTSSNYVNDKTNSSNSGLTFVLPTLKKDTNSSPFLLPIHNEIKLKNFIKKPKTSNVNDPFDQNTFNQLSINTSSKIENENVNYTFVNLSKAICSDDKSKEEQRKEEFSIPFINCDIISQKQLINLSHLKDEENLIIHEKLYLYTKPSNFAKIIKLKYNCKNMPYIKHNFISKYQPEPFKFDTKSPDDLKSEWKKNTLKTNSS